MTDAPMHLAVIFENIGGYHAARLRATALACEDRGWRFTAIQITACQGEHPWGAVEARFELRTLLSNTAASTKRNLNSLVAQTLDELQPDAVAIPGWGFPFSRAALAWCRQRGSVPVLMSESKRDDETRHWWKELIKSMLVRKFEAAIVGAESHRQYLVSLGLRADRIFGGYDAVDNEFFAHEARISRNSEPPEHPFFLVVTRMIPRKNVLGLLRAYTRYREHCTSGVPWNLVICGSGRQERQIRRFIASHHLEEHVALPGFVSYMKIGWWYGRASAFIHPALHEQWGLVVNEAMAAGLPVLVSNRCGCYPELIRDGVTGFGFDPENIDDLANLMVRASASGPVLARMGAAGAKHILNFGPEQFAHGLIDAARSARPGKAG